MSSFLIRLISLGGIPTIFLTMAAESAGIPISSEIVVPLGGALASQGRLSFVLVVAAATLGNLVGSLVAFLLVRRYGRRLVLGPGRRLGLSEGHLRLAERFFERFGSLTVFIGRLLPVVRTYISFPAGLGRMGVVRFSVLTLLGSLPWNLGLAYAGYRLGRDYQAIEHTIGVFTIPLAVLVLILIGVVYLLGRRWLERESELDKHDALL
ncbi:MAG: DedA family protein [Candidatus Nephthysia bennettiae]|uniref:DedA family protein n=1 Tax=Candidatus Nephthysia bennettiae TaxID=3127016 RepID=A0A934K6D3_9BACT|nr:DedA family protein [Candidatus Dormibacteraeota bacterium]MBJ7610699.1 DedA family protein [Candidatus Dormibacteraeota bacterium]PZR99483.1 MAG: DedA family protein [Candidatus Dormibacteraeota bacterium]